MNLQNQPTVVCLVGNARAVIVDKVASPTPEDEPRITFDYSRVTEDLPGTFMYMIEI